MKSLCSGHAHGTSLSQELIAHLPHAVGAVSLALGILSLMSYFSLVFPLAVKQEGASLLFHMFHFIHILFAAIGSIVTFRRFSDSFLLSLIVGVCSPAFFCVLSDVIIPYLGGVVLGVDMEFHTCFLEEIHNIAPFFIIGIITGFAVSFHRSNVQAWYSCTSHASHILVSSLASTFYLVSHGLIEWEGYIGIIFVFLVLAVVIPCTLSDVIVPVMFAKVSKQHEEYKS